MRKRANQRLARLAKMTDDKGHVFLMYQIEPFEPKLCLPPDSDPDFCSLWTRSIASLTYWHWVVVYEQEALRLWLTDNGLLSMNKKHCVSNLQTWVVVYEQEALHLWLTDNGLLSMNKKHCVTDLLTMGCPLLPLLNLQCKTTASIQTTLCYCLVECAWFSMSLKCCGAWNGCRSGGAWCSRGSTTSICNKHKTTWVSSFNISMHVCRICIIS